MFNLKKYIALNFVKKFHSKIADNWLVQNYLICKLSSLNITLHYSVITMVCVEILLENYCLRNSFKSNSTTYGNKKYIQIYQNVRFLHVKDDKIKKNYCIFIT